MARVVTRYTLKTDKPIGTLRAALVCDLHDARFEDLRSPLCEADVICIGGDLVRGGQHDATRALDFLRAACEIAPTYYALGNHEMYFDTSMRYRFLQKAQKTGAKLLMNTYVRAGAFVFAGVTETPNFAMLRRFEKEPGYKILLCHRPEEFKRCAMERDIDLTLSGHAHGGQIRLFGRGLYAPGQGVLPRLTSGLYYGGRLLVSRGLTNTTVIPRIGNPCELVLVEICGGAKGQAAHEAHIL